MWPFTPKYKSRNPEKRKKAIAELDPLKPVHQEILVNLAKNDENISVRDTAVEKLSDQTVLADLAKNAKDHDVRKIAVKKLEDQNILADIAKNDKSQHVREASFKKLTDQHLLVDIVKNAKYQEIAEFAVKKLSNQSVLAEIVKSDKNMYIRKVALEMLADQSTLLDIAKNDGNASFQILASLKLTDLTQKIENLLRLFCTVDYSKSEIADILKESYHNNLLSQNLKADILQLKGQTIKNHSDKNIYGDGDWCSAQNGYTHMDYPAEYFSL